MAGRKGFSLEFSEALSAGAKRDYKKAISILESLAARGFAEGSRTGGQAGHPEIYLYLARAWHAEKKYAKAVSCARTYARLCPEDASGWFFLGRSFLADGAFDRAVTALRRSLRLNPDSVDARILLGAALLKSGKPSFARKTFEDALSLQPENKKLMHGYLNALFVEAAKTLRRGDADLACQMFTFLINNGIDGVAPRLYLGHSLRGLGRFKDALEQYIAAQEFAPADASLAWYSVLICLDMGDAEGASNLLAAIGAPEAGMQVSPQFVSLRIIKSLLDASMWKRASDECRTYIKNFGADSAVHSLYGEAQRNLGNVKSSINHFFLALQMNPEDPAPYWGLLLVYSSIGNWRAIRALLQGAKAAGCDEKTISLYSILCAAHLDSDAAVVLPAVQEAVREYGAIPCLLLALAETYSRVGLSDLAAGWYKKTLEMDSIAPLSPLEREEAMKGIFDACTASGDTDTIISVYKARSERWDIPDSVRGEYIKLLAEREMWNEATEQMEIFLRYADDDSDLRQLARLYRNAGMYRQAAIQYRKILRSHPRDKYMLSNLVFCLDRMGERASAIALIHEANRVLKPDANLLLIEGRLCFNAGKTEKALETFSRASDLFPEDPRPCEEMAAIYRRQKVHDMASVYEERAKELRSKAKTRKSDTSKAKPKAGAAKK